MESKCDIIHSDDALTIYHIGPPLTEGKLPSVFYFSLSGHDSLMVDPFNQPAQLLAKNYRVFSLSLPGHFDGQDARHAIDSWIQQLAEKNNVIDAFCHECMRALTFLIRSGYVDETFIVASGLSRGAFMATYLASKDERISTVLGFAPLTRFDLMAEYKRLKDFVEIDAFALVNHVGSLIGKRLRYYIGNHDTLVGTDYCFDFIHQLSNVNYEKNRGSPTVELIIYPSVGHKGHGTPPEIFLSGANWLLNKTN